jgi:hypothetical protein
MTTEAAVAAVGAVDPDAEPAELAARLAELEARPVSALRTLTEPATAIMRRAKLLVVSVMVREGRIEEGGREAHQVLSWRRATAASTCWPGCTASSACSTAWSVTCRPRTPMPCRASCT